MGPLPRRLRSPSRPWAEEAWEGSARGERERPGACAQRRPGAQGWVDGWVGC